MFLSWFGLKWFYYKFLRLYIYYVTFVSFSIIINAYIFIWNYQAWAAEMAQQWWYLLFFLRFLFESPATIWQLTTLRNSILWVSGTPDMQVYNWHTWKYIHIHKMIIFLKITNWPQNYTVLYIQVYGNSWWIFVYWVQ